MLLREWGAGLYDGWQPATVKQGIVAARSFFRWCWEEGLISENPGLALKTPIEKRRIQRTLQTDETQSCRRSQTNLVPHNKTEQRNRAMVSLLFDSGLRAAELCRLAVVDLDFSVQPGELRVVVKGGNEERGYFGNQTRLYLERWLAVRRAAAGERALFVSVGGLTPGRALTPNGLGHIVRKLGRKAGIDGVSPHAFRRGFAVEMTKRGVPNSVLQDLGRWDDEKMIKRYTQGLDVAEVYAQHSPVDHL